MRSRRKIVAMLAMALFCASSVRAQVPASPAGLWEAAIVTAQGVEVPFTFEITARGGVVAGSFFDGEVRIPSTAGSFQNGALSLTFAQYGSRVDATLTGNRLEGKYDRGTRGAGYAFKAVRATPPGPAGTVPSIAGEWRIPLSNPSNKGENSWRFVVRQNGPQVSAAIMRVDGDTGTLSGRFKNGALLLSHFSGARPMRLEVTPQPDGSLALLDGGRTRLTAYRLTDARARSAAEPTDPKLYTSVRNPAEKFRFAFPDLDGKLVTDADPRFQGKVVVVSVTGSWCPNCHDEAPFMARLYRDYRAKGLEIVALAFEEPDQLKNPNRVRGFIKQYGLTYPFLIAGTPEEAPEKIPQAINLSTFPATFVLGRDGRVKAVHAGYASKATGDFYLKEQKDFIAEIEKLLAQR